MPVTGVTVRSTRTSAGPIGKGEAGEIDEGDSGPRCLEIQEKPLSPNLSKVSPWLVSSEIISSPVSKVNTTETTIIRKSVITTQL
ncbi:hypothetical protein NQ317_005827 [Molorchus minor]|uniref:Uncharacterized protein n=1 Tax=Molorchus minor TaxID=1323400 RepID=A0ABQ9JZZ1_9CUCU|nr:hypothetical protein NQ317_005827 [Molorchus minor]